MARIRSTKPEFWTSEQITECSVNARLMFLGMWNFCDDEGRHVASTKRLKMEVYPGDSFKDRQIREWMNELMEQGLVIEYDVQPEDEVHQVVAYWQVTGWHHQKISHPQKSKIPGPFHERSGNIRGSLPLDLKGRELKGIEGIPPKSPKGDVEIPEDLIPYEEAVKDWLAYKRERGETYKPRGLKGLFTKMRTFGANLPAAVSDSMANNYAGLFASKDNGKPDDDDLSGLFAKMHAEDAEDDERF